MAINRTGFIQTPLGLEINKDVEAQLTYTFQWSDWLPQGDSLSTVTYTVAARRNDPTPVTIESSGISGTKTYVELAGGQKDKTYLVNAKVTTADGIVDKRQFRLNVVERTA
jgi:hypothetical protein